MAGPRYSYMPSGETPLLIARQLRDIKAVLDYLCDKRDYGRKTLTDLELEVGFENKVVHGLGVKPIGWRITQQSAAAFVYEDESSTDSTYLYLLASGDVTVDLEVW